jgi:hypothetical protein
MKLVFTALGMLTMLALENAEAAQGRTSRVCEWPLCGWRLSTDSMSATAAMTTPLLAASYSLSAVAQCAAGSLQRL